MNNYSLYQADLFAQNKHAGQVRKYTGEPYISHPRAVCDLVEKYSKHTLPMQCAALLHNTLEDTDTTLPELVSTFGIETAMLVNELTDRYSDPSWGNRAVRKRLECKRIQYYVSGAAKTIKLADLIDNSGSIMQHDPEFAEVYLAEKESLLNALVGGSPRLMEIAKEVLRTRRPYTPPAPSFIPFNTKAGQ